MGLILIIFTLKYDNVNQILLHLHTPRNILNDNIWELLVKLISYGVQITIDYFVLWLITKSHKLSILMVIVSISILVIGYLTTIISNHIGHPISPAISSFFVKMVKSQVVIVLFIAAYIVESSYKTHRH